MRVELLHQVDGGWWNQLVGSSPHGTVFQTYNWREFQRQYMKYDVKYLVCLDERDTVRGLLSFNKGAPGHMHFFERFGGAFVIAVMKRLAPVFNWQEGPVLLGPEEEWTEILDTLITEVVRIARINRIARFTMPLGTECHLPQHWQEQFKTSPWATYRIDLDKPTDDLWHGFKGSARKNVKRAQRDGIVVETVEGEEGRREYQSFREACMKRRGARCFSVDQDLIRYRLLNGIGAEDIYVAKYRGMNISSLVTLKFNGFLFELGAHQSEYGYENKLYGNDLIKWEIIQRAQSQGVHCYDLSGVSPDPQDDKEKGIDRFKKKWGGTYSEYPVFSGK